MNTVNIWIVGREIEELEQAILKKVQAYHIENFEMK